MSDNSNVKKSNILVVDDEREHAQVMCEALHAPRATSATSPTTSPRRGRSSTGEAVRRRRHRPGDGRPRGRAGGAAAAQATDAAAAGHARDRARATSRPCKQALNEGAYDFIEKPLDLDYFRAQVNRAAEKSALQKQNQVLQEQVDRRGRLRRDHRQEPGDAARRADRPAGRRQRHPRADHGRERHRQGADRPRDPQQQPRGASSGSSR